MTNSQRILGSNSKILGFNRMTPSQVQSSGRLTVLYKSRSTIEEMLSHSESTDQAAALGLALGKINEEISHLQNSL